MKTQPVLSVRSDSSKFENEIVVEAQIGAKGELVGIRVYCTDCPADEAYSETVPMSEFAKDPEGKGRRLGPDTALGQLMILKPGRLAPAQKATRSFFARARGIAVLPQEKTDSPKMMDTGFSPTQGGLVTFGTKSGRSWTYQTFSFMKNTEGNWELFKFQDGVDYANLSLEEKISFEKRNRFAFLRLEAAGLTGITKAEAVQDLNEIRSMFHEAGVRRALAISRTYDGTELRASDLGIQASGAVNPELEEAFGYDSKPSPASKP